MTAAASVDLFAHDVTGQKRARASNVSTDSTVRDLVQGLLEKMRLHEKDVTGHPIEYRARLEREGRHLHDSELVGDALLPDDEIVLHPKINAG
jgi:hypothetical protein